MTKLTVAALQLALPGSESDNIAHVSELVREAASKGAKVVLPPELFEGPYFCRVEDEGLFSNARPLESHPSVVAMQKLAAELNVYIPTSFFEADGPHHYNSLAMIDAAEADGRLRPNGPVVEYTGGSTGVSLALVCAVKQHPLHIVTSDAFAREKLDHMRLLGAGLQLIASDAGRMTEKLTRDMIAAAGVVAERTGAFWTDRLS